MGPVDSIWLNMDTPENLMVIDGLMVLDGPADWSRVVSVVQRRLVDPYPPFRQIVVESEAPFASPVWQDDPDFQIERQLIRATLPSSDDAALQRYVEEHMVCPLPRDRPLWQTHLIDGYHRGAVLYTRIHHCIADGIALNQVILSMTELTADGDLTPSSPEPPARAPRPKAQPSLWERLGDGASASRRAVARVPELFSVQAVSAGMQQVTRSMRRVARLGAIADKLILNESPTGPLTGSPGVAKRVFWATPFPLADVKRLGRQTGSTVNDVLLGTMAGALGSYVAEQGGERRGLPTMVPVNVRDSDAPLPAELGNEFALVVFEYPAETEALLARISAASRRMDAIKHSAEAPIVFSTIAAIGRTTKQVERRLVDFFSNKAVGVTTNVPGPRETRYLGGNRVHGILAWVPTAADQTLGLSIFTYDGTVWVGFKTDENQVPEPEALVRAFDAEVQELIRLAGVV